MRRQVLLILAAAVVAGCAARLAGPIEATGLSYPETRRVDQVDDYFGTLVADPYRWLEDMESPEVDAWVEAQNTFSIGFLTALPDYERIYARLDALWRTERMSVPRVHDGHYFLIDEFAELYAFFAWALGMEGHALH